MSPRALPPPTFWRGLVQALDSSEALDVRCAEVCRVIAESLAVSRVGISLVDRERARLVTRGAYDPSLSGSLYEVLSRMWSQSLEPDASGKLSVSAWCIEKREQVFVPDAEAYDFRPEETYQRSRVVRAMGVGGYLLTPVVRRKKALGILAIGFKERPVAIGAETRDLMIDVAALLGMALEVTQTGESTRSGSRARAGSGSRVRRGGRNRFSEGSQIRALMDILREGVLVVDGEGRIQYVNRSARQVLDLVEWEVLGRPWEDVLVIREREAFASQLAASRDGTGDSMRRWTVVPSSGGEIDVELRLLPLSSTLMEGARAIVMEDVTERMELQRVRDEFASMLVHDLKAPLQSIAGFAELLETERLGEINDDQREFIQRIERSSGQMMELIGDILQVARYEAGRSLMSKENVVPAELVREVIEGLEGTALPAGIGIDNEVADHLPAVYADPLRLTQVFQNLIANALSVSPEGSRITLRAEPVEVSGVPQIRFVVHDQGPGLDPEDRAHLFDKFWVGAARANGNHVAHGLGLVIARMIVEGHGGTIAARGNVDDGTTVAFTIPVYRGNR